MIGKLSADCYSLMKRIRPLSDTHANQKRACLANEQTLRATSLNHIRRRLERRTRRPVFRIEIIIIVTTTRVSLRHGYVLRYQRAVRPHRECVRLHARACVSSTIHHNVVGFILFILVRYREIANILCAYIFIVMFTAGMRRSQIPLPILFLVFCK